MAKDFMNRAALNLLTLLLLVIVTAVSLVLNLPGTAVINEYSTQALVYGVLTTFTIYFGILLSEGELSTAHVVGMVAFLSLPPNAQPVMLWSVFFGGLLGGALLIIRTEENLLRRRLTVRTARSIITISARVTLSFLVAGQFYIAMKGALPLTTLLDTATLPLLVFSLLYTLVYLALYLLETYTDGYPIQRILRNSAIELFVILVLPLPFGIVSALLIVDAPSSLIMFVIGTGALTLGLYGLSRVQHQFRKQLDESRLMAAVSQTLQSELSLDSLLHTIYEQVSRLLNIHHFLVAFYDPRTHQLSFPLAIQYGQSYSPKSDSPHTTLLQHVLDTQQPLLISHNVGKTAASLGLPPPEKSVQSWLGVPLLAGGKLLGAMLIISDDPQRILKPADQRLLTTIAATASVAIDNAQLYAAQTGRAEQLMILNRVMALLTVTLSPDAVLDAVVSSASIISKTTGVAVYLCEGESVKLVRDAGLSDTYAAHPPELLLTDFSQGPVIVTDALRDARTAGQRDMLRRENKAAWLEMPLLVGETGVGVLVLYYDAPRTFSETGIEIVRAFANQAAQAIKNARQYTTADRALERRAEQMYALATLGRQLTAPMDAAAICDLVLSRALQLTHANAGFIALNDAPTGSPILSAQAGYPPEINLSEVAFQNTIAAEVLRAGLALTVSEARRAALPPVLDSAQSQLAVPVIQDTRVVGVIVLESTLVNAFHDEDLHFLIQLANHTTIAIDNSRLFSRIAEARDRLEVMLNAMTEAIILVDPAGTVALANPRVSLIGLNPNQLLGQKIGSLLADGDLNLAAHMGFESAEHCQAMIQELQTPGSWLSISPASFSVKTETGAQFIQRHIIPVSGVNGEPVGVLLVFYDHTEERELWMMREELSRMIIHDLRSPLAAVTTGLKLLREVIPPGNTYRGIVDSTTETSQRAIRKILSRVDSLLDVSRMEAGQITLDTEPTELATLVDSVCIELSPLAHELEVKLDSEVENKLPLLEVDPDKIERVLQNLVDNALKYNPADTAITIRAYQPGSRGAPQGFIRVEVADQGPGVPDEYKLRLFERFVQLKGQRGSRRGIGLGLTFCKMTVESHGGHIWIEDNPGGGSIFAFTLPVVGTPKRDITGEYPAVRQPQ